MRATITRPRPYVSEFQFRARRRPLEGVRRAGRFARIFVGWAFVGAFTGLFLGLTVPPFFGYHNMVVMSGSMEPAIHTGDIVIVEEIAPTSARIGDVDTFKDPAADRLISHRVRRVHTSEGTTRFVTKGDATNSVQRWSAPVDGTIGRVVIHLWKLGYVLFWVATPLGRMLFLVIPAVALGAVELVRIWRPRNGGRPREAAP